MKQPIEPAAFQVRPGWLGFALTERGKNPQFAVQVCAGSIKILVQHRLYYPLEPRGIIVRSERSKYTSDSRQGSLIKCWSRREELNTPFADYDSAALTLSYTGKLKSSNQVVPGRGTALGPFLTNRARQLRNTSLRRFGNKFSSPQWTPSLIAALPFIESGM